MTAPLLLRGRLLTFVRRPESLEDETSFRHWREGGLLIENGRIIAVGAHDDIRQVAPDAVREIDHHPNLIMPGFIDPHIHMPQMQVIGSYAASLLEWLNTYTFVEEQRFDDPAHAARIAGLFLDELIRQGTTTALSYCSVHKASADAYFTAAEKRGMLMAGGKVMMDRNAPEALRDTAQSGYDDTKALIATWQGRGRAHVAITPRFAVTSTGEQMEMAGTLAREHPDLLIQTHLSENHDEIALACQLYPQARDYTDIYARYGLLTDKALFGHCIHLSAREIAAMSEAKSVAVFCPTSNLFLGSGLFDLMRFEQGENPVRTAIATDVGGGTSYSMLKTLDEAYKVTQLRGGRLNPLAGFFHITLGNAQAMGLADRIGTLEPGSDADLVVLEARATPAMRLKMERVETLSEELFLLQTLGDDRAVAAVYVAGEERKAALA